MTHSPVSTTSAETILVPQDSVDLTAAIEQTQQDPVFRYLQESADPLEGFLQKIFDHPSVRHLQEVLSQQLDQFFNGLGSLLSQIHLPNASKIDTTSLDQIFQTALNVLLILMGIIFLYFLLQWLLRSFQALQKAFQKRAPLQAKVHNQPELELFSTYWQEANHYESIGDLPAASRSLYLAFLGYLSEKQLLAYLSARSNWEYSHLLQSNPRFLQVFQPIAQLFEHAYYGKKAVITSQYTACKQPFEALLTPDAESRGK